MDPFKEQTLNSLPHPTYQEFQCNFTPKKTQTQTTTTKRCFYLRNLQNLVARHQAAATNTTTRKMKKNPFSFNYSSLLPHQNLLLLPFFPCSPVHTPKIINLLPLIRGFSSITNQHTLLRTHTLSENHTKFIYYMLFLLVTKLFFFLLPIHTPNFLLFSTSSSPSSRDIQQERTNSSMTNLFCNFYSQHTHTATLRLNRHQHCRPTQRLCLSFSLRFFLSSGAYVTLPHWLRCCAAFLLNETRHDRCTILAGRLLFTHTHTHACTSGEKIRDVTHTHTKRAAGARAHVNTKRKESARSRLSDTVSLSPPPEVCSVVTAAAVPSMEAPAAEPTAAVDEVRKIELFARITRPNPTEAHPKRSLPVPVELTRHATRTQSRRKRANAFFHGSDFSILSRQSRVHHHSPCLVRTQ